MSDPDKEAEEEAKRLEEPPVATRTATPDPATRTATPDPAAKVEGRDKV